MGNGVRNVGNQCGDEGNVKEARMQGIRAGMPDIWVGMRGIMVY